jgi:hypothetical protein
MTAILPDRIIRKHWDALPDATRQAVEAAVPAGYTITLTAGYRAAPGTADVRLRRGRDVIATARGRDLAALCRAVLREFQPVVVTTDGAGYITSIEEVA